MYRDLKPSIRQHVLFDYDTKQQMADNIGISRFNFLNNISRIRKQGYIRGKKIDPSFIIHPEEDAYILYKFVIKDGGEKEPATVVSRVSKEAQDHSKTSEGSASRTFQIHDGGSKG